MVAEGIGGEDADAELGGHMGLTVLKASGAEVNGGGKGVPFGSPLILLFNGGSRGTTALPFFPTSLPSFPIGPPMTFLLASSSSNTCSCASSTPHRAPFPFSSLPRRSFLKPGLDDKLCRTELYEGHGVNKWERGHWAIERARKITIQGNSPPNPCYSTCTSRTCP